MEQKVLQKVSHNLLSGENITKEESNSKNSSSKNPQNISKQGNQNQNCSINNPLNSLVDLTNVIKSRQGLSSSQDMSQFTKLVSHIFDLFFDIRKKIDEVSILHLRKIIPIEENKEKIKQIDPIQVLNYIKQIVQYLVKQKLEVEEILKQKNDSECSDYEQMLQKLEAEVRQHIRLEQQLKLLAENTQQKLEDCLKEKEQSDHSLEEYQQKIKELKSINDSLSEKLQKKEEEVQQMKRQWKNLPPSDKQEDRIRQIKEIDETKRSKRSISTAPHQQLQSSQQLNIKQVQIPQTQNSLVVQQHLQMPPTILQEKNFSSNQENEKIDVRMDKGKFFTGDALAQQKEQYLKTVATKMEENLRKSLDKCKEMLAENKKSDNLEQQEINTVREGELPEKDMKQIIRQQEDKNSQQQKMLAIQKPADKANKSIHLNQSSAQQKQIEGENSNQQQNIKQKAKYSDYSTLDSERIRSLSKKINDMQNCYTYRATNDGKKNDPIRIPQNLIHQSQNFQTKSHTSAISSNSQQNQVRPSSQIDKYKEAIQNQIPKKVAIANSPSKVRCESNRSYSMDGHSKSTVQISKVKIQEQLIGNQNNTSQQQDTFSINQQIKYNNLKLHGSTQSSFLKKDIANKK